MTTRLIFSACLALSLTACGSTDDDNPATDSGIKDSGVEPDGPGSTDSGGATDTAAPADDSAAPDSGPAPCNTGKVEQVELSSGFVCTLACGGVVTCKSLADGSVVSLPGWTDVDLMAMSRGAEGTGAVVAHRTGGETVKVLLNAPASQAVVNTSDVDTLVGGDAHFCAKHKDGTASCWGRQDFGQLGMGKKPQAPVPTSQPVTLPETQIQQIAAGGHATCVIRSDKQVACAGVLSSDTDGKFSVVTALGGDAQKIYMGGNEPDAAACAVDSKGTMSCTYEDVPAPASQPTSVAVGPTAVCAIAADELFCEGENWDATTKVMVSVEPLGLPDAVSVHTDGTNFCAVTTSDEVWCWGGTEWKATATKIWP